jgi:hypothetical protein
MDRRHFLTLTGAAMTTLVAGVPVIGSSSCSFCDATYPEAAWLKESQETQLRICDQCAATVELAVNHLDQNQTEQAISLLKRRFASELRVATPTGEVTRA